MPLVPLELPPLELPLLELPLLEPPPLELPLPLALGVVLLTPGIGGSGVAGGLQA